MSLSLFLSDKFVESTDVGFVDDDPACATHSYRIIAYVHSVHETHQSVFGDRKRALDLRKEFRIRNLEGKGA